jgi:hypothetical protein
VTGTHVAHRSCRKMKPFIALWAMLLPAAKRAVTFLFLHPPSLSTPQSTTPTTMNRNQQTSTSPSSRRTFSDRISSVGAKINRALSSDAGRGGYNPETESITSTVVEGQGECPLSVRSCGGGQAEKEGGAEIRDKACGGHLSSTPVIV